MRILETRTDTWLDEADGEATAQRLAQAAGIRLACIELVGGLGAGKTTFTRHLLHALGVQGRIKSPSYAVVEPHSAPGLEAWHFDFYRFDDPREWEDAGFRELYASPGLKIAEWPDRVAGLLPVPDLRVTIELVDDAGMAASTAVGAGDAALPRRARFDAFTPLGVGLLP